MDKTLIEQMEDVHDAIFEKYKSRLQKNELEDFRNLRNEFESLVFLLEIQRKNTELLYNEVE